MGSCVSVRKDAPESAIKLGVIFHSSNDRLQITESPIKAKFVDADPPIKAFQSFGSKEETFFDSQPWLESDCEDDFFSVNGDFTPSRGNTPVHQRFAMGTPKQSTFENKSPLPGSTLETSPTGKKKRLYELFRETLENDQDAVSLDTTENKNIPKSAASTPYISGTNSFCSSEMTNNSDALFERERSMKSKQSCLPSLMHCHGFSDRKKMSPNIAVNANC